LEALSNSPFAFPKAFASSGIFDGPHIMTTTATTPIIIHSQPDNAIFLPQPLLSTVCLKQFVIVAQQSQNEQLFKKSRLPNDEADGFQAPNKYSISKHYQENSYQTGTRQPIWSLLGA
jgi:hypothetical protein